MRLLLAMRAREHSSHVAANKKRDRPSPKVRSRFPNKVVL